MGSRTPEGFLAQFKRKLQDEFLSIEGNPTYSPDQKVERIIFTTAAICAGVAIQPIPFADMPILTTIQGLMGYKIGCIRGIHLAREGATETLKYVGGVVGLGWLAQQTAIGLYKLGLPFLGGFMTIPLVFGLTYGIGRAMDAYFRAKQKGRTPTRPEILAAFKRGKQEGKKAGKSEAAKAAVDRARGN